MTDYDDLVERCAKASFSADYPFYKWSACSFQLTRPYKERARIILSEAFRTLENVTPEMDEAGDCAFENGCVRDVYFAMLRASPGYPPKDEPR
jgi:hypothetical protein